MSLDYRRNGSTYGAFQSKDPIMRLDEDVEVRRGGDVDGHGTRSSLRTTS